MLLKVIHYVIVTIYRQLIILICWFLNPTLLSARYLPEFIDKLDLR